MTGDIFISYRRESDQAYAGRLFDRLAQAFGRDRVFLDVDAIEPGLDFSQVLSDRLQSCKVVLAIIGPHWSEMARADGKRRLDDPDDFVRIELETALARNLRVIPVLVGDAAMPLRASLPESLGQLVMRQAVRLTHDRFAMDANGLIDTLKKIIDAKPPVANRSVAAVKTQKKTQGSQGWSARWIKTPGMLGWSMKLMNAQREHLLEATLDGIILNGEKIADQPVGFNVAWDFKIDNDPFRLVGKAGLFSVKLVKLSVGPQLLIEWKNE